MFSFSNTDRTKSKITISKHFIDLTEEGGIVLVEGQWDSERRGKVTRGVARYRVEPVPGSEL